MDLDRSVWVSLKGEDRKFVATEVLLAYTDTNVDQFEIAVNLSNGILLGIQTKPSSTLRPLRLKSCFIAL